MIPAIGTRVLAGYPSEWPAVSWLVKIQAGWQCENCSYRPPARAAGGDVLTAHHIDGNPFNLCSWNLVSLCLRCHGLAQRRIHIEVEQFGLFGPVFPWLTERRRERQAWLEAGLPVAERPSLSRPAGAPLDAETEQVDGEGCGCGCGRPVPVSRDRTGGRFRRYASQACRQRLHRDRLSAQGSLLVQLESKWTPAHRSTGG